MLLEQIGRGAHDKPLCTNGLYQMGFCSTDNKKPADILSNISGLSVCGDPKGTRTPVTGVRGQCPRPLDDGAVRASADPSKISPRLCQAGLFLPGTKTARVPARSSAEGEAVAPLIFTLIE